MYKYLYILLLVSFSLACGASANLIQEFPEPTEEVNTVVEMVVIAEEGLNIRVCPGINCLELDEDLKNGEVVTCDKFQAPMNGDGLWCHHERGWSNARWLLVK